MKVSWRAGRRRAPSRGRRRRAAAPKVFCFSMQKRGNDPEENEDSFSCDEKRLRFAIADGASESAFSKLWADLLTKRFVEASIGTTLEEIAEWLGSVQREWYDSIDWESLPWYGEEKARRGAYSTFLCLVLERRKGGFAYKAAALGDSCLFHLRGAEFVRSFPVKRSDEFSNRPPLLCSLPDRNAEMLKDFASVRGFARTGDILMLATDSISVWLLSEHENGMAPWMSIMDVVKRSGKPSEGLRNYFTELILSGRLRNDDVTLVVICL